MGKKTNLMFLHGDRTISSYIKNFLEKRNFNVYDIDNYDDVVIFLREGNVDIILLDIYIKWYNSLELLKRIRSTYIDIPIIVLGDGNIKNIISFQQYCISDYIIKPINNQKLFERINKSMEEKNDLYLKYYHIGELYLASKNYEIAEPSFIKSIILKPDFEPPYVSLIDLYFDKSDMENAKLYLKKGLEHFSESDSLIEKRGDLAFLEKNYNKAIKAFKHVTKISPLKLPVRLKLARAYFKTGDFKQALSVLLNTLRIKPDFKDAVYETISIYEKSEDYNAMYVAAKKGMRYFKKDQHIILSYMKALYKLEKFDELISFLKVLQSKELLNFFYNILQRDNFSKIKKVVSAFPEEYKSFIFDMLINRAEYGILFENLFLFKSLFYGNGSNMRLAKLLEIVKVENKARYKLALKHLIVDDEHISGDIKDEVLKVL